MVILILCDCRVMSLGYPIFRMATTWAMKPVRPMQMVQIFPARLLSKEAVVEFKQRLQIVFVYSHILHIVGMGIN